MLALKHPRLFAALFAAWVVASTPTFTRITDPPGFAGALAGCLAGAAFVYRVVSIALEWYARLRPRCQESELKQKRAAE